MLIQMTPDECAILVEAMDIVVMAQTKVAGWSQIAKDEAWQKLKLKLERASKLDRRF